VGTEDSGVILIFMYYKCYITFVYPFMVFFFFNFGGILEFIYFKKYHIYYVIYAYFYV